MNYLHRYAFLTTGFLAGFVLGVWTERMGAPLLERLLFFVAIITIMVLWQWFENISHKRHLSNWNAIHSQGKFRFITMQYLVSRGLVLLLLSIAAFLFLSDFKKAYLLPLVLFFLIALFLLAFRGYQEWTKCEEEIQTQGARNAIK